MPRVLYFIVIILVIRLIMFNVNNKDIYILGGEHTAKVLERSGSDSFVYIYHEYNGSDSLNPQLAWYSHGWNLHERPGKYYYPVPMPKNKISMKAISSTDKFANAILVYYVPDNIELAYGVIREIKKTRNIMYLTKNYIIFGTVKRKRQKEKSV